MRWPITLLQIQFTMWSKWILLFLKKNFLNRHITGYKKESTFWFFKFHIEMGRATRWFKRLFSTKKSLDSDSEKEQNKQAIAVATTTATTAEAAVSAAKAAESVVTGDIITRDERWAAMKIQKVFRGSLVNFYIFKRLFFFFYKDLSVVKWVTLGKFSIWICCFYG